VFKRRHSGKHFSELYPQDGGENQLTQIWIETTSLAHPAGPSSSSSGGGGGGGGGGTQVRAVSYLRDDRPVTH